MKKFYIKFFVEIREYKNFVKSLYFRMHNKDFLNERPKTRQEKALLPPAKRDAEIYLDRVRRIKNLTKGENENENGTRI